ncbi:MAG: hypothetical protein HZA54_06495 [Planctomycetes bacterium]|nr:hypothetical protein [Planctomycetota bacterium]
MPTQDSRPPEEPGLRRLAHQTDTILGCFVIIIVGCCGGSQLFVATFDAMTNKTGTVLASAPSGWFDLSLLLPVLGCVCAMVWAYLRSPPRPRP